MSMGRLVAVGAAGCWNRKYCEGLLTSGQGLFDKLTGLKGRGLKDKIKFLIHANSIQLEKFPAKEEAKL